MKILVIIQARIGSTRLPKKVLLDLEGKPVLEHVINRVMHSKLITDLVVATTISKSDLELVKFCSYKGISIFCGSEEDVLDRFYQAAKLFSPDHIVRITADCPLMDPKVIDKVISVHLNTKSDYTTNTLKETYPDGEDVEVFTFKSLKIAWENATLKSEREHVTPFIRKNPNIFSLMNVENDSNLASKRWTIDNSEDYEFLKIIYKNLYSKESLFSMDEILKYIEKNPDIESINMHIGRNEGYQKSLKEDKITDNKDGK